MTPLFEPFTPEVFKQQTGVNAHEMKRFMWDGSTPKSIMQLPIHERNDRIFERNHQAVEGK